MIGQFIAAYDLLYCRTSLITVMFTTSTVDCIVKRYITCVRQNFVVQTTACALVVNRYVRQRSSYDSCNSTLRRRQIPVNTRNPIRIWTRERKLLIGPSFLATPAPI